MIALHVWPTPNGYKPLILLEELGLPYEVRPVDIFRGEQFAPEFLAIAPNGRIPALVDTTPPDGGPPLCLFESGAILLHLAERDGRLLPTDRRGRDEVMQWLFWQVGGLGPMMGQAAHFLRYAPEDVAYAKRRYVAETERLLGVLDRRLAGREHVCGDLSIADVACYPWVRAHDLAGVSLDAYPNLAAWAARMAARPAVIRAYAIGEPLKAGQVLDEAAREHLFGRRA